MSKAFNMEQRNYSLSVQRHTETGWYIASSDELPEFLAHGKDFPELRSRIRSAVKHVLEIQGCLVNKIELTPDDENMKPTGFETLSIDVVVFMKCAA